MSKHASTDREETIHGIGYATEDCRPAQTTYQIAHSLKNGCGESQVNQDIYEAALALVGKESMRNAGIDQAFAANFAKNIVYFDNLGERSRQRIKDEFLSMSYELSYLDNVARKHSEEKVQALATWLRSVNLLLAMSRVGGKVT